MKALFLDIDGTLLADDRTIPEQNTASIRKMLEKGHFVILATGRPLHSAVMMAEDLGLTGRGSYIISYNGGVLYDTFNSKVIYRSPLKLETVRKVFHEAERRGIHIQTYNDNEVLVEKRCDNDIVRMACTRMRIPFRILDSIDNLQEPPVKMLIADMHSQEPLLKLRDWILSWAGDELSCYFSRDEFMEIVNRGLNKGSALEKMAKLLGVDIKDTIAAGDHDNDIDMIRAAGTGCAMLNATSGAKQAADYITEKDNNQAGVSEIIEKFIT
ncbi:MAG: Cof-type HAD-IIB family hydrolase [Sphaerochaetaceae bacterium]|nr:Cof-type HAD-IIB family hydrolase [Sphaerochaetaceae bacterium]